MIPVGISEGQTRIPYLALSLALGLFAVYLATAFRPDFEQIKLAWGFVPQYECLATLFTHMFLHENGAHVLGNLLFFIVPAMKLEDAIGPVRLGLLFMVSGIAANACHVGIAGDFPVPLIGASGAISGVVGAFMVLYPTSRLRFWLIPPLPFFPTLPAWFFLGYWFAHEIAVGYLSKTAAIHTSVAVWAHVGGFAFGAIMAWAFYGWGQGRAMESFRGLASEGVAVQRLRRRVHRPIGLAIGASLLLSAASYALAVFSNGGLVNPRRPTTAKGLGEVVVKEIASGQDAETLFRDAVKRGTSGEKIGPFPAQEFWTHFNEQMDMAIDRHGAAARGRLRMPPGWVGDRRRFYEEEFQNFPAKCRVGLEEVHDQSILYRPGKEYEMLCGTNLPPKKAFLAYLKKLNACGWAFEAPAYAPSRSQGWMASSDGEWELEILIAPSRGAIPDPVMVLWVLRQIDYEEDRQPRE